MFLAIYEKFSVFYQIILEFHETFLVLCKTISAFCERFLVFYKKNLIFKPIVLEFHKTVLAFCFSYLVLHNIFSVSQNIIVL